MVWVKCNWRTYTYITDENDFNVIKQVFWPYGKSLEKHVLNTLNTTLGYGGVTGMTLKGQVNEPSHHIIPKGHAIVLKGRNTLTRLKYTVTN